MARAKAQENQMGVTENLAALRQGVRQVSVPRRAGALRREPTGALRRWTNGSARVDALRRSCLEPRAQGPRLIVT